MPTKPNPLPKFTLSKNGLVRNFDQTSLTEKQKQDIIKYDEYFFLKHQNGKYLEKFYEFIDQNKDNFYAVYQLTPQAKLNIIRGQNNITILPKDQDKDEIHFNKTAVADSTTKTKSSDVPFNKVTKAEAIAHAKKQTADKFKEEPTDSPVRVGVVVMEPDGRMWIHKPSDYTGKEKGFAGKKYEFSRGQIEEGYKPKEAAIMEAYEEMGLKVEIVDYLTDNDGVRYYVAKRIGGHPSDFEYETDEVILATPDKLKELFDKNKDANGVSNTKQDIEVLNVAREYQKKREFALNFPDVRNAVPPLDSAVPAGHNAAHHSRLSPGAHNDASLHHPVSPPSVHTSGLTAIPVTGHGLSISSTTPPSEYKEVDKSDKDAKAVENILVEKNTTIKKPERKINIDNVKYYKNDKQSLYVQTDQKDLLTAACFLIEAGKKVTLTEEAKDKLNKDYPVKGLAAALERVQDPKVDKNSKAFAEDMKKINEALKSRESSRVV